MNIIEWIANKIVSTLFAFWPQPKPAASILSQAKIVAHRGVHENNAALENSIESFQLALDNQIWAVELDIHFTRDNVPVIIHDEDCGRLFQRPDLKISALQFAELRKQVPKLPTLEEVITQFGKKLHLMIEIKEDLRGAKNHVQSLKKVLSTLQPIDDYHLLTLNPDFLANTSIVSDKAILDVIWLDSKSVFEKNMKLGHGAIAGHFLFFNQAKVQFLKSQGKYVGVGFLDSQNSLYRELGRGVDFIFTNHPLRLKRILNFALDPKASKR